MLLIVTSCLPARLSNTVAIIGLYTAEVIAMVTAIIIKRVSRNPPQWDSHGFWRRAEWEVQDYLLITPPIPVTHYSLTVLSVSLLPVGYLEENDTALTGLQGTLLLSIIMTKN